VTRIVILRLASLAGTLMLAACGDGPRLGDRGQPLAVTRVADMPAPTGADLIAATTPYRIGPLDKLGITVFGAEDLSGNFQTDAAGRLSMPLLGSIDAAGSTPGELGAAIATRLRSTIMRNPQVTVNLLENGAQTFTIDGQVTQPGSYPVTGNMSLMRAVATAKGAAEFARMNDVVVFRKVGNQSLAALYNLSAIRHGNYADPKIYANDIIVVGDSNARRLFQSFIQVAPLLTTPVILLLEHRN
jgi:polysaccharide export outer membrane protein